MHGHLVPGRGDKAGATRAFYEEYFAVTDLPAEFYLDTVQKVFQDTSSPWAASRGAAAGRSARHPAHRALHGRGRKDDICAVGQTVAAQDLCTGLRPYMRRHHVQIGAGHYGVFNGAAGRTRSIPR